MSLRIRQVVLAARDLEATVLGLTTVLGAEVCYRDPEVAKFGLHNALLLIGDQFLEVVSPIEDNTAAGRHLDRHGDSGYMLIFQTDDLAAARARPGNLGVRIIWESVHPDISAFHLHPKDTGAAIISIDQPVIPESWPWAGKSWQNSPAGQGARKIVSAGVGSIDPEAIAKRWAGVLGLEMSEFADRQYKISLTDGDLFFTTADTDIFNACTISIPDPASALDRAREAGLAVEGQSVMICGVRFVMVGV